MKLKYLLLILLLLVLFLNFMTQEHFIDTLKDQLDQKIDDIISTGNINDPIHQSKIRSHSILANTLTHYSLKNNKVLLTLFYDKYNEHSLNFYDNSEIIDLSTNKTKYNTWNMLKKNHLMNENPYIDPKLLVLEEVKCDGNDISNCINTLSNLIPQNISPSPSNTITTEQPPRSETLIDKLPKVILSFLKPIDIIDKNIQYEYIIAEYNGIYSMNEPEKPLAYHNILHFIQETLDKHLEIKKEEKKDHEDKFGHTFDTTPINTDIKAEAPIYLDYKIYKCNECCVYYKEKN
jgi:hypothetical protein